jgi:hypothetical protein
MSLRQFSCGATTRRLHARAEGRLTPAELEDLDRHLGGCEGCRQLSADLAWSDAELVRGRRSLPFGFADRVVREVSTRQPAPVPRARLTRFLPLAAALLLAAGLSVLRPARLADERRVEPPRVQVELELAQTDARTVAVAGDFNDWQADAHRMRKGPDGVWRIRMALPPGRYQYVFVIDEQQWVADPRATTLVDSGYTGANSVLDVSL